MLQFGLRVSLNWMFTDSEFDVVVVHVICKVFQTGKSADNDTTFEIFEFTYDWCADYTTFKIFDFH